MDEIMKVLCCIGARPNFVKVACFPEAFKNFEYRVVHLGQHKSDEMSGVFLEQFGIKPDYFGLDEALEWTPDVVLVIGDVNSQRDACLKAKRGGFKVAHIESGLRSFDMSMPEELNRIIIDHLSDYRFVTEQSGIDNLKAEGLEGYLVGNTMIDTAKKFGDEYILFTAHRPSNVDGDSLDKVENLLAELQKKYKVVFPVHPRTKLPGLPPQDYLSFQNLLRGARLVVTDSGGVQEEAVYWHIPCLTLRENTERPLTLQFGNKLVNFETVLGEVDKAMNTIPCWDGRASERIAQILYENINL